MKENKRSLFWFINILQKILPLFSALTLHALACILHTLIVIILHNYYLLLLLVLGIWYFTNKLL